MPSGSPIIRPAGSADAERLYRQILAADPGNPDALHLLGLLASQVGRHDLAAADLMLGRAHRPHAPLPRSLLQPRQHPAKPQESWIRPSPRSAKPSRCRPRLRRKPRTSQSGNCLARARAGLAEAAAKPTVKPLPSSRSTPSAQCVLGLAHARPRQVFLRHRCLSPGHRDEAPAFADAFYNLGNALSHKADKPMTRSLPIVRPSPSIPALIPGRYSDPGETLLAAKGGVAARHRRLPPRPSPSIPIMPRPTAMLGNALKEQGQLDEAIAACRKAIDLQPNLAECAR